MKIFLLVSLLLLFLGSNSQTHAQYQPVYVVSTFNTVPKDMEGCGENFFMNKIDEKKEKFILYSDYIRAIVRINNKMVLLMVNYGLTNRKIEVFSNKDYTLIISDMRKKATGDEDYDIKSALITIKYNSKIIWSKIVIGGGGC